MEKKGELEGKLPNSMYYPVKAVITEIMEIGVKKFISNFRNIKVVIPPRDGMTIKDDEIDTLLDEVLRINLHDKTGI